MKTFFEELEERGRAEGRAEGELKGERKVVLSALRKKFTVIPDRIETTISQMSDPAVLESLVNDLITCQSLDEFATALK
jgi:predicted transposase YdaD